MALIDDIEFYGRAVDAGELTRDRAAELLARDSNGFFTVRAAASWIDRGTESVSAWTVFTAMWSTRSAPWRTADPSLNRSKLVGGKTRGAEPARAHSA